jgi:uncharacterized protein YndB with AHSA1/START domain
MTEQQIADNDVFLTRSFRAPRALVWRFWTEPELIAQWFGPTELTVPLETVVIEPRVGGRWQLAMQGPDGQRFPMIGVITELVPEELLVVTASAETDGLGDIDGIALRIQFHDHGELTRVTLHQGPFTPEQRTATATGWEQSFVTQDSLYERGVA